MGACLGSADRLVQPLVVKRAFEWHELGAKLARVAGERMGLADTAIGPGLDQMEMVRACVLDYRIETQRAAVLAAVVVVGVAAAVALPAVLSQSVVIDATTAHFRIIKTAADGFDSGWHIHPGVAIVQVQQGSFQI